MMYHRNILYFYLLSLCCISYFWLYLHSIGFFRSVDYFVLCTFKQLTHLPCPSCGVTRAILKLSEGELRQSVFINPLGIFIGVCLILIPFWILWDIVGHKKSLVVVYQKLEYYLQQKKYFFSFLVLILINWTFIVLQNL